LSVSGRRAQELFTPLEVTAQQQSGELHKHTFYSALMPAEHNAHWPTAPAHLSMRQLPLLDQPARQAGGPLRALVVGLALGVAVARRVAALGRQPICVAACEACTKCKHRRCEVSGGCHCSAHEHCSRQAPHAGAVACTRAAWHTALRPAHITPHSTRHQSMHDARRRHCTATTPHSPLRCLCEDTSTELREDVARRRPLSGSESRDGLPRGRRSNL
jgi:hypothetical protein